MFQYSEIEPSSETEFGSKIGGKNLTEANPRKATFGSKNREFHCNLFSYYFGDEIVLQLLKQTAEKFSPYFRFLQIKDLRREI